MENERHQHNMAMKEAEKEIYEVNRSLATITANFEKMQKDTTAVSAENKQLSKQVSNLFEEKAASVIEMQNKLER